MTETQKIILTCMLGPEDPKAWHRGMRRRQEQARTDRKPKRLKATPKTPEQLLEEGRLRALSHYRLHREERLKYAQDYREKHPEKCQEANKKSKLKHREDSLRRNRRHRQESLDTLNILKEDKPCFDCGGKFPSYCMDWDHLPGKEKLFDIGDHATKKLSVVLEEISKCQLVCACCHRIRTFAQKQAQKKDN